MIINQVRHSPVFSFLRRLIPNTVVNKLYHFPVSLLAVLYYRYPAKSLTVIGVTGTDGKTTTANLIYQILKTAGKKVAVVSTISAKIGDRELETGLHVTSPHPFQLQKLIRQIVDKGYQYLVLEVTSHGLSQYRTLGCNFKIAVVTNVTPEHLDYHKAYQQYLETKSTLFKKAEYKVLNLDDDSYLFLKQIGANKTITYGFKKASMIRAKDIRLSQRGTTFVLQYLKINGENKKIRIATRLYGEFNVLNCLASCAVSKILNIDDSFIKKVLAKFKNVKGRMEIIETGRDFKVIVDFAHTPNALENALQTIRQIYKDKKIIAVFGSAGLRDKQKRPQMGKIACQLADQIVLTAEDPRTEDVNEIIDQIAKGCENNRKIIREPDREKAIRLAITKLAREDEIVALFGKGHEESICLGKTEYPWSDVGVVQKILKEKGELTMGAN